MAFTGVTDYQNGTKTREEVLTEWNKYVDQFKTDNIDPILSRMNQAKSDWMNAYLELQEKKVEIGKEHSQVVDVTDVLNKDNTKSINIEPVHNPNAFITEHELQDLKIYKKLGTGVSRV